MGEVVGDVAGALALAILLHHLGNLRGDRFSGGGRIALGIEFAGPLGILALSFEHRQARFIDALRAGPALDLLLVGLFVVGLFGFLLVDQAGFQELLLQRRHLHRSGNWIRRSEQQRWPAGKRQNSKVVDSADPL